DDNAVGLVALEGSGVTSSWRRGTWARDVAVAGGAVLAVDDRGRVRRFDGPGEGAPAWTTDVGGAGPTRLAAGGDRVYAARPISGTIVVLDAAGGAEVGRIAAAAVGAGTDDVAATADGMAFTIDAARGVLAAFAPDGTLSATLSVGLSAPPRFLAVADTPAGRVAVVATDAGEVERYDLATGKLIDAWSPVVEGRPFVPADVAIGSDGTVYVAQREPGAVHAFPPGPIPISTPPGDGTATPTPGPLSCRVVGTKGAAPARIVLGESVGVSITLRATCPAATRFDGADVLLVVDRSGSMAPDDKLSIANAVAARLAHAFRDGGHRVGLVTFAGDAALAVPLGAADDVAAALHGLEADGTTDIAAAIELARTTFASDRRAGALPLDVLLSDGRSATAYDASALATDGVLTAAVAVGYDAEHDLLGQFSAAPDLLFTATAPDVAHAIHHRLLTAVYGTVAGNWAIDDALGVQVELVERSPLPAAVRSDDLLRWSRPVLPPSGITLTYRVRPLVTGWINTNRFAYADYTDADGARRRYVLPIPVVEVIAPTATATPEPTATFVPTATIVPPAIFLPIALTERCRPTTRPIDAVLVIDASTSMLEHTSDGRTKLDAARASVGAFLDALRLARGDRAAVVTFHQAAAIVAPLTSDRGRLDRALGSIATDRQTCLVCGVDAAISVLGAVAGQADRQAVIVLLTDGRSNPRPASEAVTRAEVAKAAGVSVFTIGLGAELDVEALAAIASSPRAFFRAVDAAALDAIYRDIARELPCPPGAFWGRR
ncbi:MAG: VWA domain-containing protein, partial [Ardenticatenales bacterium]